MSDDDEYYEWEEEYLFEDPVPDLVDELAATSYYEAALYEDPGIDVEDYFSDWDYYSDDYYDDDPTVKASSLRAKAQPATQNRSPKNRRANAAPRAHNPPLNIDIASFQGVVWKTASLDVDDVAVQIYEPGQAEKVALLENWREIFKSAQPALDKSRLRNKWTSGQSQVSVSDSDADDESLGDDEQEDENEENEHSDEMSDVVSLDQTNGSVDASNTTPELGQSPKEASSIAIEIPVKRGRKRKAEVPAKDVKTSKTGPGVDSTTTRSKRVALDKSHEDGGASGPVRRSTRQKK